MVILAALGLIALIGLIFGPQFWINWTMKTHATERADFPGTGGEMARQLLDDAGLQSVKIEIVEPMRDHYAPDEKTIRLSKENFEGKSVTAVAVAAHEVGHAIQDRDGYWPLTMRQKLAKNVVVFEKVGSIILMASPLVFALTRSPVILLLELAAALGILALSIVVHIFTLPTEYDASFKKALPLLRQYLPEQEMKGATKVLRAAAYTYVAGALVSLISVGRWLRILRF
jgi:uncharacterized protein